MKGYWEADFELLYNGVAHVWSELTDIAKLRIHNEFGAGELKGQLRSEDFKAR